MQLKQLINQVAALKVEGSTDAEVAGITYDSRRITPGMVFVAIPGRHADGHDFISVAIDRGAAAVISERNGFTSQRATRIKVADAREALAQASAAFYGHPSRKLQMIAVTGTNGKTTVSFMIKHMLEKAGIRTGLIGTVRYEIGERLIPAHRTTPEALDVQNMLAQMVRADCQACVMEVSSHALDQKRVQGIDFDVAIFTNLTQDHLDYHGTMEQYFQAKKKLFDGLSRGAKPGAAVINVDDSYGARLNAETDAEIQLTYGIGESAKVRATGLQLGPESTRLVIEAPGGRIPCVLQLIGRHNIYNALAAAGAGVAMKVDFSTIGAALESLPSVPGRLERISCGQPFGVFVDYAHTDDALCNVLKTVREITRGRVLLCFGCGGNRDVGKRAKMGRVAAELADLTLVTTDNPRRENPAMIAAQIEQGYRAVREDGCRVELDRRRALDEIIGAAAAGDVVLVAGKGHETYQEFEDTVIPFDDRIYVREALENRGYKAG